MTDQKNTTKSISEEFEEYLIKIGGLNLPSLYLNRPMKIFERDFFKVSEGWLPIIKELIADLIKMGWNKKLVACGAKSGSFKFMTLITSAEMDRRVAKAELAAYRTCEACGSTKKVRPLHNKHTYTLCKTCEEDYSDEIHKN